MANYLYRETSHVYTVKQIYGCLTCRGITRKKLRVISLQRDELYLRDFRVRMRHQVNGKNTEINSTRDVVLIITYNLGGLFTSRQL